jgi:hypothetical protein
LHQHGFGDRKSNWLGCVVGRAGRSIPARYHGREDRLEREERDNNLRLSKKAEAKLKALNETVGSGSQSVEQAQENERKRAIIAAAIERAKLAADKNNTK